MNTNETEAKQAAPSDKSGAADAHPLHIAEQVSTTNRNIRNREREAASKARKPCPVTGQHWG